MCLFRGDQPRLLTSKVCFPLLALRCPDVDRRLTPYAKLLGTQLWLGDFPRHIRCLVSLEPPPLRIVSVERGPSFGVRRQSVDAIVSSRTFVFNFIYRFKQI